jgi:hypothetical protein
MSGVDEVNGLAAVNSLRRSAVEEDILDVELMDRQSREMARERSMDRPASRDQGVAVEVPGGGS